MTTKKEKLRKLKGKRVFIETGWYSAEYGKVGRITDKKVQIGLEWIPYNKILAIKKTAHGPTVFVKTKHQKSLRKTKKQRKKKRKAKLK